MKKNLFFLIIALFYLFSTNLYSQVTFSGPTSFPTGTTFQMVCADFNGDGKQDFATANLPDNSISVCLNTTPTGNLAPSFSSAINISVGIAPGAIIAGDFNLDGKPDLAVTITQGGANISILVNTTVTGSTTPSFSGPVICSNGSEPAYITAADFNGDGKLDIASAYYFVNAMSVFLNSSSLGDITPSFSSPVNYIVAVKPFGINSGDINNDGKPDIVVGNNNSLSNSISVFINTTPTGSQTASFGPKNDFSTNTPPIPIAIADFNLDGKLDVAAGNTSSSFISIFLNYTTIGSSIPFLQRNDIPTFNTTNYFTKAADLNGDGKPDLIGGSYGSGIISVFINTTNPGDATPSFYARADFDCLVYGGAITDINGDRKPDILTSGYTNAVKIMMNTMTLGTSPASFSPKIDFIAGNPPVSVCSADYNLDGKADLATCSNQDTSVSVLMNNTTPGNVAPSFSSEIKFKTGLNPSGICTADFNGDGKPDLASVNKNSDSLSILLNTTTPGISSPSFTTKKNFATGASPFNVCTGDFNLDGLQDLACTNFGNNSISVFLNTTSPGSNIASFSVKTDFSTNINPYGIVAKDFNGDGKIDLAFINGNLAGTISVYLNSTSPGAATPSFYPRNDFSIGGSSFTICSEDFNGDGRFDIACTSGSSNIFVLFNGTAPGATSVGFSSSLNFLSGSSPTGICAADFNGDGIPDISCTNNGSNSISVLLNQTIPGAVNPNFAAKTDFSTGAGIREICTADFNLDGKKDLCVVYNGNNRLSVFLNNINLVVPVELQNFSSSVNNNNITLNWSTSQEQNNRGFDIERNSFGKGWEKIGFVQGTGTTNSIKNYSYNDNGLQTGTYQYRLKQIDYNGNFKYYDLQNEVIIGAPNKFLLEQNYPNPFNPNTIINYQLAASGFVSLKVYDITGKEIAVLVNEAKQAGYYSVSFDGKNLSSGVYFYKLTAGSFTTEKKMVLVK
ncbi:MAG: T9SS type A sorting domain-containing protein [Ignavibacteria bacterium]|nr:T9SS type A sorting domain-containing protein [Ignavibacteria bacterium]